MLIGDDMNKLKWKFTLSLIFLINTIILIVFFPHIIPMIEPYLFPFFFVYFLVDVGTVFIPHFNKYIYSNKMLPSTYIEVPGYDQGKLKQQAKKNNYLATLIFILYAVFIVTVGELYLHISWIGK